MAQFNADPVFQQITQLSSHKATLEEQISTIESQKHDSVAINEQVNQLTHQLHALESEIPQRRDAVEHVVKSAEALSAKLLPLASAHGVTMSAGGLASSSQWDGVELFIYE